MRLLPTVICKELAARARWVIVAVCVCAPLLAKAEPWMRPGDLGLRHDLAVLADAGLVRTPVTTWPVSWPDVARDVGAVMGVPEEPAVAQALFRVQRAARAAARPGYSGIGFAVAGATDSAPLRDFGNVPREQGEASVAASWLGERLAAAVTLTAVADASDDQTVRLDGSYVGINVGNFMVSLSTLDRWWGPGWDGSLILGSNARPLPSITIERNYTDASRWPVLRWFGPWRASLSIGQAEGSDVAVPDVRLLAARVTFKPRPWLEFALSRTAQWCGQGRPCGFGTFKDLVLGRDNRSGSLTINDEPGNQMAGYDFRLRSPWRRLPLIVYGQAIGEDEANGLPSKFLGLLGAEVWGGGAGGSWRARFEFADTACTFTRQQPDYNCAYRNGLYPQGYAYRDRIVGHPMDNDGRMYTVAGLYVRPSGTTGSLVLRKVELNRDGTPDPSHALSPLGASELRQVELQLDRPWLGGAVTAGVGYDDWSGSTSRDPTVRGYVRFHRGF